MLRPARPDRSGRLGTTLPVIRACAQLVMQMVDRTSRRHCYLPRFLLSVLSITLILVLKGQVLGETSENSHPFNVSAVV